MQGKRQGTRLIFEILMMVCFGLAWPMNIYNSLRSRSTRGKNLFFLCAIAMAYIFGIIYKSLYSPSVSIVFYVINLVMVCADIFLYFLNRTSEIKRGLVSGYARLYC